MPARIKVRAVIWIDGRIVVHRTQRHGRTHVTLPGGRVVERESVIDALHREVREEIDVKVEIDELLFVAEVFSGARMQDVELVFAARLCDPGDRDKLATVDPGDEQADVLPPVLAYLRPDRRPHGDARWLGNLYKPRAQTTTQ